MRPANRLTCHGKLLTGLSALGVRGAFPRVSGFIHRLAHPWVVSIETKIGGYVR